MKLEPMALSRVCERFQELFSCMSLMRALGLGNNPADTRAVYGVVLTEQHAVAAVRSAMLCVLRQPATHARLPP